MENIPERGKISQHIITDTQLSEGSITSRTPRKELFLKDYLKKNIEPKVNEALFEQLF